MNPWLHLCLGCALLVAGLWLTTFGGFIAKDGWEKLKGKAASFTSPATTPIPASNQIQSGRDSVVQNGQKNFYAGGNIYFGSPKETISADREAGSIGSILPANDPMPLVPISPDKNGKEHAPENGEKCVIFGPWFISTPSDDFTVVSLKGKNLLGLKFTKDIGLLVYAYFYNLEGKLLAKIEKNIYTVNPKNTLPLSRPDKHSLIVCDEENQEILNVRFLNPSAVQITGTFRFLDAPSTLVASDWIEIGPMQFAESRMLHLQGKGPFLSWPPSKENINFIRTNHKGIPSIPNVTTFSYFAMPDGLLLTIFRDGKLFPLLKLTYEKSGEFAIKYRAKKDPGFEGDLPAFTVQGEINQEGFASDP